MHVLESGCPIGRQLDLVLHRLELQVNQGCANWGQDGRLEVVGVWCFSLLVAILDRMRVMQKPGLDGRQRAVIVSIFRGLGEAHRLW